MIKSLEKWITKALIIVIVLGLLASLPLAMERIKWENTSNQVEIVLDYDDIFLLANNTDEPEQVEDQFFTNIQNKVTSIAVYETTLERLKLRGEFTNQFWVYSGKELLDPFRTVKLNREIDPKHTYLLFSREELRANWVPQIETFLSAEGKINLFQYEDYYGIEITAPYRSIKKLSLGIDPELADKIKSYGFNVVPRISNSYPDQERTIQLVKQAASFQPTSFIFAGEEVVGFPSYLEDVAAIMNQRGIGLGMVEMTKDQLGIKNLGYHLAHYNEQDVTNNDWGIIRVHALAEQVLTRLIEVTPNQLKGLEGEPDLMGLQEQVELATTERNIRLIYMHADMPIATHVPLENFDLLSLKEDPQQILKKTEMGINKITERLQNEGFTIGQATPFQYAEKSWMGIARWLSLLGGIGVISLLAAAFVPSLNWLVFVGGLFGIIVAKLLNLESLYFKFIGLGTAVAVPVLALKYSLSQLDVFGKKVSWAHILKVYFVTSLISFLGAMIVTGMFNHIKYSLYLDQFRGVSVLYLLPLVLTVILVMWHYNEPLLKWLQGNFKNYYLVLLGIVGIMGLYYLARSGNEATVSTLEVKLRSLLQSNLDIRPRTKEFLIGYPVFLLGIYLAYSYKKAAYFLVGAAMAQLSIVSTFTHLHTPFIVSLIRTGIGLALGLFTGIIAIIGWKVLSYIWEKLARRVNW